MRPTGQTVAGGSIGAWMPVDAFPLYLSATVLSGAPTYSVEMTADDIFNPAVTPQAFPCGLALLTGAILSQVGTLNVKTRAVRLNVSGTGTVQLTTTPTYATNG